MFAGAVPNSAQVIEHIGDEHDVIHPLDVLLPSRTEDEPRAVWMDIVRVGVETLGPHVARGGPDPRRVRPEHIADDGVGREHYSALNRIQKQHLATRPPWHDATLW